MLTFGYAMMRDADVALKASLRTLKEPVEISLLACPGKSRADGRPSYYMGLSEF